MAKSTAGAVSKQHHDTLAEMFDEQAERKAIREALEREANIAPSINVIPTSDPELERKAKANMNALIKKEQERVANAIMNYTEVYGEDDNITGSPANWLEIGPYRAERVEDKSQWRIVPLLDEPLPKQLEGSFTSREVARITIKTFLGLPIA